jgi:hypothetical protein
MLKHFIGAGLLTIVAFVIRFRVLPRTLDIYVHDTYIVMLPSVIVFWLLLAVAAVWLVLAALKFHHRSP